MMTYARPLRIAKDKTSKESRIMFSIALRKGEYARNVMRGWMSKLEFEAMPILTALIKHESSVSVLADPECLKRSRFGQ